MKYNINTFAAKYGVKTIGNIASIILTSAYVVAILLPRILPNTFNLIPMTLGHISFLIYFISISSKLDEVDPVSIKRFYKGIWNLFYSEYMLYPFI